MHRSSIEAGGRFLSDLPAGAEEQQSVSTSAARHLATTTKTRAQWAALTPGIAVRAGHHCAQPALRRFGLDATVRPSLGLYNTHDDIDILAAAVRKAANALRR